VRARVVALTTTPVKGMRVATAAQLRIGAAGAAGDRRFYVVDERGWMVNGKRIGSLSAVVAAYDEDAGTLALTFPDGSVAGGTVQLDEEIDTRFFSRPARARPLLGAWSQALSEHVGEALRIVEGVGRTGIDRGRGGAVSVISRASIDGLARAAGAESIDARRFRMTVEVDGVAAHEEDGWLGRRVRIGEALVRVGGHVGRCLITSRDPDSGVVDLPTLDLLRAYRSGLDTTEPLPFGVYGAVLEPGTVALGDAVELA
jgi:uncharacterized protein YcbX